MNYWIVLRFYYLHSSAHGIICMYSQLFNCRVFNFAGNLENCRCRIYKCQITNSACRSKLNVTPKASPMLAVLPPGVRNPQKWTSCFSFLCIWGIKCICQDILSVFRHLQRKHGPGTSPRDAPYPGYIESCASTCFVYNMKVLFWPFESVEHLKWPQTGIWKSRARAEYKNAEIKVSHSRHPAS